MQSLAKVFMGVGALVLLVGVALWALSIFAPRWRLFRLPGDFVIEQENARVFVPFTTMLLISGVVTLIIVVAGLLRK